MEFKVKYSDCDSYRVVHNSNYIAWFEDALYSQICDNEQLKTEIIISKIRCRNHQAVKYNSIVFIKTKISKIAENNYSFRQELVDRITNRTMVISMGEYMIGETYESFSS